VEGPPLEVEGAEAAESRAGSALEDGLGLGLGDDLRETGSVSSLESIAELGAAEEGDSTDTDEEVHVGMMFKRRFDARRGGGDKWAAALKGARDQETDDVVSEQGDNFSVVGSVESLRSISRAGGSSMGSRAGGSAVGSSRGSGGLGSAGGSQVGSLFMKKFGNKMALLKGMKASLPDREGRAAPKPGEVYVPPPEVRGAGRDWIKKQREAVALEEEDLELFLHGGAANLPPPEPVPEPPSFQNRPDMIGFRIDDPVTAEYNRWASRADEHDYEHVDYDDDEEEEDETGKAVHARARAPSMLKLLRLQTQYANMSHGANVSPMPGSESNLTAPHGLSDSFSVASLATAGTRDRSIKFFDSDANLAAASAAAGESQHAGVLHRDYQRFAMLTAAERKRDPHGVQTDDSLAVLDRMLESAEYRG
jgi:hypothetical protein